MADDNLERQEVDYLIRELATPVRKPAPAKPAPNSPVTPPATPAADSPGDRSTSSRIAVAPSIVPRTRRRRFVSAISFAPNSLPSLPVFELPRFGAAMKQVTVVRLWVALGVLLCLAMPYWPYPRGCSWWWVLFYLFAVAMVVIAGIWSARLTWITRLGVAHCVALGIVLWGITLAAEETLPRIGYAKTEATWICP